MWVHSDLLGKEILGARIKEKNYEIFKAEKSPAYGTQEKWINISQKTRLYVCFICFCFSLLDFKICLVFLFAIMTHFLKLIERNAEMIQKVHWKGKVPSICNKYRFIIHDSVHLYSYKTRGEGAFLYLCLPPISCSLLHKPSFYFKGPENEHSLWTFPRSSWNSVNVCSALKGGKKWKRRFWKSNPSICVYVNTL